MNQSFSLNISFERKIFCIILQRASNRLKCISHLHSKLWHNLACRNLANRHMSSLHRGAFCRFLFRWIYYYGSYTSTGKEARKTHLCALGWIGCANPKWLPRYVFSLYIIFSWSIFIRAVIDHMTCYNLNWPKIKLWGHDFVFSCALNHILKR